jgi:hypothetical protein
MKVALLALLAFPAALFAATLRVNNAPNTSPDHTTIQAAINAAADGDTILIEGSTTPYAAFTLTNKRLNLIGPGYGLPLNAGTPANKLTAVVGSSSLVRTSSSSAGSADGSLVMGIEFSYELYLEGCANVTVARCSFGIIGSYLNGRIALRGPNNVISQCFFSGNDPISVSSGTYVGSRIENCIMAGGSLSVSGYSVLYLRNNVLYGLTGSSSPIHADNNIFLTNSAPPVGCIYRNNIFPGTPSGLTGSGNLTGVNLTTVMPAYQNNNASFDGRYKLSPLDNTNPAYNAGVDGTHIGPFGGSNPYILSGIPPLPTIDELSVPTFAAPGGNVTIRVKVGARP